LTRDAIDGANRAAVRCVDVALVEELKPEVVSFHFGLPSGAAQPGQGRRLPRDPSATSCASDLAGGERRRRHHRSGAEAGRPSRMFLTENIGSSPAPRAGAACVDAVKVPVIAAGGIETAVASRRRSRWCAGVQICSAYLRCRNPSDRPARMALARRAMIHLLTQIVMTGRPRRGVATRVMREVGPISLDAPAFRIRDGAWPLKAAAEKQGKVDFTNLWPGSGADGARMPAAELTRYWAGAALARSARWRGDPLFTFSLRRASRRLRPPSLE